jgi:hypothetical protein
VPLLSDDCVANDAAESAKTRLMDPVGDVVPILAHNMSASPLGATSAAYECTGVSKLNPLSATRTPVMGSLIPLTVIAEG